MFGLTVGVVGLVSVLGLVGLMGLVDVAALGPRNCPQGNLSGLRGLFPNASLLSAVYGFSAQCVHCKVGWSRQIDQYCIDRHLRKWKYKSSNCTQ